jgi:hypothetical protein
MIDRSIDSMMFLQLQGGYQDYNGFRVDTFVHCLHRAAVKLCQGRDRVLLDSSECIQPSNKGSIIHKAMITSQ